MAENECIKLAKVRRRGYVRMREVKSLKHYLFVPKLKEISMVYNVTLSGLKSSLWEPHIYLPTVGSTLRSVERDTFLVDRDIEEMFINFMVIEEFISFWGLYITNFRTEEEWERHSIGVW